MNASDVARARALVAEAGLDGWLLYDFRGQNTTAQELLGLTGRPLSRRFFYWIPASGDPVHVVHAIERTRFPELPGAQRPFSSWESLKGHLAGVLRGARRVAMEYVPGGTIPYLSRVDAGTVEWVRSLGPEVVSSASLVQKLLCVWSPEQLANHRRAATILDDAKNAAFRFVAERVAAAKPVHEHEVQALLMDGFEKAGLVTDHPPNVSVNAHAGDPHYEPSSERPTPIRRGDLLLIDLWGKLGPHDRADAPYGDITWTAFVGDHPPEAMDRIFGVVADARDASLAAVAAARTAGRNLPGFEADRAARAVIERAGFGERFFHRTGHSLGFFSAHGDGANLDGYETNDTRELLPGTAFTIEPGIYLPEYGIRSEIDVYLAEAGPEVTGPVQRELLRLL